MNRKNTDGGMMPKDLRTKTQITPDEMKSNPPQPDAKEVAEEQVEQDAARINPDINSMESRG